MEIERKFLVQRLPALDIDAAVPIKQGYIMASNERSVRLRQYGSAFICTVKSGSGVVREEVETSLTKSQFEQLWPTAVAHSLEKKRLRVELASGDIAELDLFGGSLAGLLLVEVEFDTEEAAHAFEPPCWFGEDVTADGRYTNSALSKHGVPTV